MLIAPLLELLRKRAPLVSVEFDPLHWDHDEQVSYLQRRDVMVGGSGLTIPGRRQVVFRDRFVCLADSSNRRVAGSQLTLDGLAEMPHAGLNFGGHVVPPPPNPFRRAGIEDRATVRVPGLLSLPFAVAGTGLIAFVPERLAQRCAETLGLVIIEVPWQPPDLVEAVHWHPARSADPTLKWLQGIFREVSVELAAGQSADRG